MSHTVTLSLIDNIASIKLESNFSDLANTIANILHDVWRVSLGKKNGSKYTETPFYVNDSYNIKTNVNVPYNELPKQFTELNYNLIMFTLKLIFNKYYERQICYYLINEYRRIINTSERGGPKDCIFNLLPEKEQHKCIDIYNLCMAFIVHTNKHI